jgi:hypothetical protein
MSPDWKYQAARAGFQGFIAEPDHHLKKIFFLMSANGREFHL